jgi:hypothetical protein
MSTFQALALALLATLPLACRSNSSSADVPCRCGTELGDLEGCAHPACMAGKNNPDNPNCVCGTIEIPATKKD